MTHDWENDENSTLKRKDAKKIFKQLDFDITHKCNKNCSWCNLQISKSNFSYLTKRQYEYVVSCIKNKKDITGIKLTGGEPLVHPKFNWLVKRMLNDFPNASIKVMTNGKLLPNVPKRIFNKVYWRISEYRGWNDEIIKKYADCQNVLIHWSLKGFDNPIVDLKINEQQAKEMREKCMFSVRIIGTDLYGCCLSNAIERTRDIGSVHCKFDKNWKKNWKKLKTWKACRYCLTAYDNSRS